MTGRGVEVEVEVEVVEVVPRLRLHEAFMTTVKH